MKKIKISKAGRFKGEVAPPPDKSISHRAIMFSSLSKGRSVIRNFLRAGDTMSTLNAMRTLGVNIQDRDEIIIEGRGIHALKEPLMPIDCGNSGTTMRLITGILSGNPFLSVLVGDESLTKRPMARVINPMKEMGAAIMARQGDKYPPIAIRGGGINAIDYTMPMSSAQVKSSILLAGLYAGGETKITEPVKSRDHTEVMLPAYGADLKVKGLTVSIKGGGELHGTDCIVPGDFSSAAFFIVAGLLIKNSDILLKNVCLNPTRTGLLKVIKNMGAKLEISNQKKVSGEEVGDIHLTTSDGLKGVEIKGEIIPSLIDEFPILCILGAFAEGVTTIRDAEELRVKESDRIKAMAEGLRKMGVEVEEHKDGLSIKGTSHLKGAEVDSFGDHRIAMSFAVAGLCADGETIINGADAVGISFPGFFEIIERLRG